MVLTFKVCKLTLFFPSLLSPLPYSLSLPAPSLPLSLCRRYASTIAMWTPDTAAAIAAATDFLVRTAAPSAVPSPAVPLTAMLSPTMMSPAMPVGGQRGQRRGGSYYSAYGAGNGATIQQRFREVDEEEDEEDEEEESGNVMCLALDETGRQCMVKPDSGRRYCHHHHGEYTRSYVGVRHTPSSMNGGRGRWMARIKVHGKEANLGSFDHPKKAALAYDAARIQHRIRLTKRKGAAAEGAVYIGEGGPPQGVELRRDPQNGDLYSEAEFAKYYGEDSAEWDEAEQVEPAGAADPDPRNSVLQGAYDDQSGSTLLHPFHAPSSSHPTAAVVSASDRSVGSDAEEAEEAEEARLREEQHVRDKAKIEAATLEAAAVAEAAENRPTRAAETGKSTLLAPPAIAAPGAIAAPRTRGALIAAPAAAKTVDDDADGADGEQQQNPDGAAVAPITVTPALVRYGREL